MGESSTSQALPPRAPLLDAPVVNLLVRAPVRIRKRPKKGALGLHVKPLYLQHLQKTKHLDTARPKLNVDHTIIGLDNSPQLLLVWGGSRQKTLILKTSLARRD